VLRGVDSDVVADEAAFHWHFVDEDCGVEKGRTNGEVDDCELHYGENDTEPFSQFSGFGGKVGMEKELRTLRHFHLPQLISPRSL
jgi:hypothetical protein